MMAAKYLPALAAATTSVLIGATMVASRFVIEQTAPASLALLRYMIGAALLLPIALISSRMRFERRDILPIALLGITQFGILVALLNVALQHISSGRASLIFALTPLLTLVLATTRGYEAFSMSKFAGVILSIVGVGLAVSEKLVQPTGAGTSWFGEGAVVLSALCGAVCSVLYRPYLRKYPTLPVSAYAMVAAVVFLVALAAGEGFFTAAPRFTATGWLVVVFIGVSSGLGYYLWLWALNHTNPTNVTVFLALSPLTAMLLGVVWLAEAVTLPAVGGLLCIVIGIWVAHRR